MTMMFSPNWGHTSSWSFLDRRQPQLRQQRKRREATCAAIPRPPRRRRWRTTTPPSRRRTTTSGSFRRASITPPRTGAASSSCRTAPARHPTRTACSPYSSPMAGCSTSTPASSSPAARWWAPWRAGSTHAATAPAGGTGAAPACCRRSPASSARARSPTAAFRTRSRMQLPRQLLKREAVWPAYAFDRDSGYSGTVPMGALLAIPPSVDIDQLGLSPLGRVIARAAAGLRHLRRRSRRQGQHHPRRARRPRHPVERARQRARVVEGSGDHPRPAPTGDQQRQLEPRRRRHAAGTVGVASAKFLSGIEGHGRLLIPALCSTAPIRE